MLNINNIPNEIKVIPRWVGHKNKVPIDLKTGKAASSTNPHTWTSFVQAVNSYKRFGCDGIGWVFQPPFIGVDLDDAVENGVINQFGNKVIEKLASYTEYSPSGTGIHIICKGDLQRAVKTGTHEVYNTARYFTMTGNVVKNLPLRFLTTELKDLGLVTEAEVERNKQGWIKESLARLQPGNLHNESVRIIGRLHEDGWDQEDIFALLKPHIERIGGNQQALRTRCESIARYPRSKSIVEEALQGQNEESDSISTFLAGDEKVEWIVPGIISEKCLGFVAGLPETGKTWMLMDLAVEAARGGYWLGKFPVKETKTVYIDQERFKGETKRRFDGILRGKNIRPETIEESLFIKCGTSIRLDLQHSFDSFKRYLQKVNPGLVIVDSFATFHTKEENNRKEIQEVLEKIKQLRNEIGCSFVFIDHENKSVFSDAEIEKEPSALRMVGSVGKPAAAEFVLTVRKTSEGSFVYHTKSTLGPALQPFLVKVEDLDETKRIVKAY